MFIASDVSDGIGPKKCLFYTTGGFGSFFQTRRFFWGLVNPSEPAQNPSVCMLAY
jgi:hypothetical protein